MWALGAAHLQPPVPTSHPKELGLISVGSLLWVYFESTHQGLTHVSGPVLGAVGKFIRESGVCSRRYDS